MAITEFWLKRSNYSGLINDTVYDDEWYSVLDSNVDFCINLLKLYEKTEQEYYHDKAEMIVEGIVKYFKARYGYYWKIDTKQLKPLTSKIETKYLGLLIKLFVVYVEFKRGKSLFKDSILRNLARDR